MMIFDWFCFDKFGVDLLLWIVFDYILKIVRFGGYMVCVCDFVVGNIVIWFILLILFLVLCWVVNLWVIESLGWLFILVGSGLLISLLEMLFRLIGSLCKSIWVRWFDWLWKKIFNVMFDVEMD